MRSRIDNRIDLFFKEINCTSETLKKSVIKSTNYIPPLLSNKNFDIHMTEWLFLDQKDMFTYLGFLRAALHCKENKEITKDRARQLAAFFDWYVSNKTQDYLNAGVTQSTPFFTTYTEFGFSDEFATQCGVSLLIKPVFEAIADLLKEEHSDLLRAILQSVYNVYTIEPLCFNFFINSHAYSLLLKVNYPTDKFVFALITRSKYTLFLPSPMKESLVFCNNSVIQTDLIRIANLAFTNYRYNVNDLLNVIQNESLQATERFEQFLAFSLTCIHPETFDQIFPILSERHNFNLSENFNAIAFHKQLNDSHIKALIERLELHKELKEF